MKLLIPILLSAVLLRLPAPVLAAKKRVMKTATQVRVVSNNSLKYSSVRLSRPTNSIAVTFQNLSDVSKISYELSYSARGIAQGVAGSLMPSGQRNESRDLYFGTCSHAVCTPHTGITNAFIIVRTTKKNGAIHAKRYKIKV